MGLYRFAVSAAALFLMTAPLSAQETDQEIIDRIKAVVAANELKEILPVEGDIEVPGNVHFLETLKFEDTSTLRLEAGENDAVFLMAKEIRLNGPEFKASIRFFDRDPIRGKDGIAPPPPRPALKRSSGNGNDGMPGQRGAPGMKGVTRQLPTLYIVTNEIDLRGYADHPYATQDIRIYVDGIDGGVGGTGGKGQAGQKGQAGRHGKANGGICSSGPRSGGDGGKGGAYGLGGNGGDGGDGGSIIFIVSPDVVDDVKDMRIRTRGGLPGLGGLHGQPGQGGDGGSRGSRPGTCSGASAGDKGDLGSAPKPGERAPAGTEEGNRGRIRFIEYADVAALFEK